MAATTTPLISKIHKQIYRDYRRYSFAEDEYFAWQPSRNYIIHRPLKSIQDVWSLLHELSHAELGHAGFEADIQLIRLETAAWEYTARILAPQYATVLDDDFIQDHLDTYRQWLHSRSLCPNCQQTGLQTNQNTYSCVNCRCVWRVNEARVCQLRRIRLQDQDRSF